MGLEERVPGTTDMWRNTPLGSELHLDLLMVFMGLWDEWEIPMILEDHGLIDDLEAEHMLDLLGARGGNPGGSPYRARERLNADTIREMHLAFNRGGRKAIDKVMKYLPDCGPGRFRRTSRPYRVESSWATTQGG